MQGLCKGCTSLEPRHGGGSMQGLCKGCTSLEPRHGGGSMQGLYLACQDLLRFADALSTVQHKDGVAEPGGEAVQAAQAGTEVGGGRIKHCQGRIAGRGVVLCGHVCVVVKLLTLEHQHWLKHRNIQANSDSANQRIVFGISSIGNKFASYKPFTGLVP